MFENRTYICKTMKIICEQNITDLLIRLVEKLSNTFEETLKKTRRNPIKYKQNTK